MAFDQTTRNRLARFVSDTRSLLVEEFTRQLQNNYGLDPNRGDVTDLARLDHLDDARHETARLLRDTMEHYLASADTATPAKAKKAHQDVLDRIVREQAFTILNRLCALRMAEARGLLIESIAKGYQSKGFQLYQRLAGIALGETGACYRLFICSVFDEFAVDLPVLFDRFSPQGRLFPREAALLSVLQEINHPDIDPLWVEDETIGWIYQYFNSVEERRQMRAESQAPRNSRELAIRNQFFTPRYVVEFLTDNTLGRIWYEMTKGETALKDSCRYLVRRPNEIFLSEGEATPEQESAGEELSPEELIKKAVHVMHRPLKDPRDIKMLDPACGSMHFGLYAFDLFERIYEEAWEIEAQQGASGFVRTEELKPLHGTYSDKNTFLRDVPRLIIERNIHGIDIDPRAVQIAGLSLWLRAQRSWQAQNIKALDRPKIQRSNIVCAEPMPGEANLLEEFTEQLQPKMLGQLVKIIFEKMKLAGEAGSLLMIEEEIKDAISTAYSAYRKHRLDQQKDSEYLPGMAPKHETTLFNFAGLSEEDDFWSVVELRVIAALRDYSEQAEYEAYQRRLFANDASQGFAFIDLCRKQYDIVLMNPPFGAPSLKIIDLMQGSYAQIKTDLYGAFVIRAIKLSNKKGVIGTITSRTGFYVSSFQRWREEILLPHVHLGVMADLGGGVLDSAMVETAAYTLEKPLSSVRNASVYIRLAVVGDRSSTTADAISDIFEGKFNPNVYVKSETAFAALPKSPFCYWVPNSVHSVIKQSAPFEPDYGVVYVGVQTDNDERFVRIWVENPPTSLGAMQNDAQSGRGWITFLKGDSTSPFYLDHHLTLKWHNNGREIRAATENAPGGRINNENIYYLPGFSWALRTDYFSPHVVPAGCIPSVSRYEAITKVGPLQNTFLHMALFSAPIYDFIAKLQMEKWKQPKFIPGVIRNLPVPNLNSSKKETLSCLGAEAVQITRSIHQALETSREFFFLMPEGTKFCQIDDFANVVQERLVEQCSRLTEISKKIAHSVDEAFGLLDNGTAVDWFGLLETNADDGILPPRPVDNLKNRFSLDHKLVCASIVSWLLGLIFGRWDIRYFTGERLPSVLPDPFSPLPVCPPAMLQNAQGFPAEPKDISSDYPLRISWSGIIIDEEDHPESIVSRVRESIEVIWKTYAETIEQKVCESLGVTTLHNYFRRPANFFDYHLKSYSRSHRQAPLYWPLSTPSGSYTIWLYYHRLTDQILYTCVNDYVEPKLKQVSDEAASLRGKSNRPSIEEIELERLIVLEQELKDFRNELLRIARFWKPNLNDGVQITAAPLWNLFQHRQWKARLKETWEKLEAGEYDWAHLALSIWPDRVVRASHKDRSYAIAHDLEDQLWHEVEVEKVGRGGRVTTTTEWQPRDLSNEDMLGIIAKVKARCHQG